MEPVNPNNARSIVRLREAMRWSLRKLEPFRTVYMDTMREYLGAHYGENASSRRVPLNLIEMVTTIYLTHLAARSPRVLVTPKVKNPRYRPMAADFELAIQQAMDEMKLEECLRTAAFQGLMSMGIVKVGLSAGSEIEEGDGVQNVAESFAEPVNIGDWVHDMTARDYREIAFAGHRYRMRYDVLMDSGLLDRKAKARLQPAERTLVNEDGDERVETLSQGSGDSHENEYTRFIDLWDMWLPDEQIVVMLQDKVENAALWTVEWDGPEEGPYHLVAFNPVPNQVMPLPPAATWLDIHEMANTLARKLRQQAVRQKVISTFREGDSNDAQRLIDASDGEAVSLKHADTMREIGFGGIHPQTLAYTVYLKDLFSQMAGNLDVLGGLGPQSETATQDQLISTAASKRMSAMQSRMMAFVKGIVRHIAWYEWTDPLRERVLHKTVAGTGIEIPVRWSPEVRDADFLDFNFDIVPYSMQDRSPAERLRTIMQLFTQVILPLDASGAMARNNMAVNLQGFLRLIERYTPDFNGGDLQEIVTFIDEQDVQGAMPNAGSPRQSPVTSRENVRVNRPGATNRGKDAVMTQTLLGAGNPQTTGSLMRATG